MSNTNPQFSGLFDQVIQGVATILPFIKGGGSAGNRTGQAKGLEAITQATRQIISALNTLVQQVSSTPPNQRSNIAQQVLEQANVLVRALSDPNIIYQAKKGDDARVLNNAKTTANGILQQLQGLIAGGSINITSTTTSVTPNVTDFSSNSLDQLPSNNNILLYGGIAVVVIYFLTKK